MIQVEGLKKYFYNKTGLFSSRGEPVKAVDGVTFSVPKGKTFGLVGESGSGKSTIAKLVTGVLKPSSGRISLNGVRDIVFQDPLSSLNPRMRVGEIIGEALRIERLAKGETLRRVNMVLEEVRLASPGVARKYPHQFSGGERQRIAIARAIVRRPAVVVLDEPVSSLDVSIQAEILNLLKDIQEKLRLTYLFISHDLRVVEFMADTVGVMKAGKLVEVASREEIYKAPQHEYTRHLLDSIPKFSKS